MTGRVSYRSEALFIRTFERLGYVIPERGANSRSSLTRQQIQFEGGLVLEPNRGFYDECVILMDFNSLYPSIIREFNLCFGTMRDLDPSATDQEMVEFAMNIKDSETRGVLPMIMTDLLEARARVKAEMTSTQDASRARILQIHQLAIKILSNAMYGCLACPVIRFQSIHIAKMITCLGRHILQTAVETLENRSYTVLYGDTDSLFVAANTKDVGHARSLAETLCVEL